MTRTRTVVGIGSAILVVAVAAGSGLIFDAGDRPPPTGTTERVVAPDQITADNTFPNPAEAAEAKARQVGLDEARVDKFVLIYADEEIIDLRVRVSDDDGCRWFGVGGSVEDGKIGWRNAGSGDGQPCN